MAKYKASVRYASGWTDPRSVYGGRSYPAFDVSDPYNEHFAPDMHDAATEALENMWLVRFGDVGVKLDTLATAAPEWRYIAHRLWKAKKLEEQLWLVANDVHEIAQRLGAPPASINTTRKEITYKLLNGNRR